MRLTAKSRAALVEAIMSDVPKVDYHSDLERIIRTEAFALLPTEVQNLPTDLINAFVSRQYFTAFIGLSMYVFCDEHEVLFGILREKLRADNVYKELCNKAVAQRETLRKIKTEVKQAIESCNTDKQVWERYPEFAKYLPTVNETTPNPPTVPIIEHLKAAGWKG